MGAFDDVDFDRWPWKVREELEAGLAVGLGFFAFFRWALEVAPPCKHQWSGPSGKIACVLCVLPHPVFGRYCRRGRE